MYTLLAITISGLLAMLAEILRIKKALLPIAIAGMLAALVLDIADWNTGIRYYHDMMFFDNYAIAFSAVMIVTTLLWLILSSSFLRQNIHQADHISLIAFTLAGAVVMVSYSDLVMLFIGLEILSISMYVMSASNKDELRSNEAGFKYFLMGSFATGFLLFGITLIYGVTGSFNLQEIAGFVSANKELPVMFYAGILLMIVGLGFKISAAPFHFWAPDVYEGAPTRVTAFMSTVVKTAAFAAFLRLFFTCFDGIQNWWSDVLVVFAALSMLGGNILAVYQKNLKRMMAYSSISHAGYMLLAVVAMNDLSTGALLLYTAAYSAGTMGIFTLITSMTNNGNENTETLKGFSSNRPMSAFMISVITLSLAGIPPVAGFFAKYYVFYSALKSDYLVLVLLAVLSSLIGVYYYFRIIITMYQPADREARMIQMDSGQRIVLWLAFILTIALGFLPSLVIDLL